VSAAADALIGGDLYEVLPLPGRARLLIADVRGKGLDAVRITTVVLGEFRATASDIDDLADVAAQLDRRLRRHLSDDDFVTAVIADVADDGTYTIANCGHPAPLLIGADIVEIATEPTVPLGLGSAPHVTTGRLAGGERLLLYTDGLIETRTPDGGFVELAPIVPALRAAALGQALDGLLTELRAASGHALADDLALLLAEYRG
jgi:sigma-B regulation protein RsbU (phosphoserine phosphatase)